MVSKLKQQLRRARGPVALAQPDAKPADGVQWLELEGQLKLKLGNQDITNGDPSLEGKRIFVGAWVTKDRFVHGERAADGSLSLRVPVDTERDVNTLKLQLYCHMVDPETQLSKPFPLAESLASLDELGAGKQARVEFNDPIMGLQPSVLKLTAKTRVDTSRLKPSAMYQVKANNDTMTALSRRIGDAIKEHKVRVPKVAQPFIEGVGFLPSGGNPGMGIPSVMTHYGILSGLVDGVDRHLPHTLLAYYLQLVLTHEGLTIDQANALADQPFAKLAGDVLWGVTQTAGGFPYERDLTLATGIQLDPAKGFVVGLQPVTSEDVGLPFAASNFIARDLTPLPGPDLAKLPKATADPRAVYQGCVAAIREGPDQTKLPKAAAVTQGCAAAVREGRWPEQITALGIDDCETSGMAGKLAANTVRDKDMGPEAFRTALGLEPPAGNPQVGARGDGPGAPPRANPFKAWTSRDVDKASAFFTRLQRMLKGGSLNISLVVGLAGGAAASTETTSETGRAAKGGRQVDDMDNLGGHCFAVLRHTGPDGKVFVRLLEGTSCVKFVAEAPDGPKYGISMGTTGSARGQKEAPVVKQALPLGQFLTLLSSTVSEETRVINRVIGGGVGPDAEGAGLQAGQPMAGFIRPTIAMRCLHSIDASSREGSEIAFYKWCLFTGLSGDPADMGTLPLDSMEYNKCLSAGCRPACLACDGLQGFGIDVARPEFEVPRAVLNEVWPPIATPEQFGAVLALWAPLPSLGAVNADLKAYRQSGVEYETVTCMESPAAPGLVEVVYRLKSALAALANKINLARPDSDRITMSVARIGTGVDVTLHVPKRSLELTFMKSLREAKEQMGWGKVAKKTTGETAGY